MVGAGISTSAGIPDFRTPGTGLDLFCLDVKPTPYVAIHKILTLGIEAGIKAEKIVTAHGSHQSSTCQNSSCKAKFDKKWLLEKLQNKDEIVIKCDKCKKGVIKPDIVFFGEKLPNRFFTSALMDFPKSICIHGLASAEDTPRLLINLTAAGQDGYIGSNNLHYDQKENKRDVFYKSTCDEGAMKLARLLGWEDELKAMINKSQKSKKEDTKKV
uniref:Deacetylase sirtuin-type domain-containing protein n=1 Tax=Ditylenchus dipsaci TaxID=166011 RepID=A0A915D2N1_9BILA